MFMTFGRNCVTIKTNVLLLIQLQQQQQQQQQQRHQGQTKMDSQCCDIDD